MTSTSARFALRVAIEVNPPWRRAMAYSRYVPLNAERHVRTTLNGASRRLKRHHSIAINTIEDRIKGTT
jgi:hypothetical protein